MTQEEKQILLKDLCARLPYKVKCSITKKGVVRELKPMNNGISMPVNQVRNVTVKKILNTNIISDFVNDNIVLKPYLRPMSSMTEEERNEYFDFRNQELQRVAFAEVGRESAIAEISDWLNARQFDYRGLIPMGLALEAKEGMYNKEEYKIPTPKTVDEAVKILAKVVSKEDRDYLLENGAISVHNSMGRWIRNEWGLWADTDSELKNELKKKGFEHPDDMSNYIIERFIKYLNDKI